MSPELHRRLANPDMGRACPLAEVGAKLARLLPKKHAAELSALSAHHGGASHADKVAATAKHDTIQSRALALEDQLTWGPAETLEGAAFAISVAFSRLQLVKIYVSPEDEQHVQAIARALWSARHALEQSTGKVLAPAVAGFLMPERMNPFLALGDEA
ncbi:hypothetical protein EOD42_07560 [Rhodovarius crocodyli]|uniref:Uncharacterized protein n=1 Tax=Rhodovarius crocodyli TaxID=1979269 RepID=A0A437MJ96_9PROT|nr:hypothetical protein [Rhodovarius crocodyli]RVT97665.1 hypothetical protein EOD42_07560 [Rhodovarius crocodyli]